MSEDVLGADGTDDDNVVSIADRAASGDNEAEELFPLGSLEGDELTPQRIIKKGMPIEVTVALGMAEVPVAGGGLLNPEKAGRVLVSYEFAKNVEVPQREEGKIVGWKVRQVLRPAYVVQANDEAKLITNEFASLLALDPVRAGQVLDSVTEQFEAAQRPA